MQDSALGEVVGIYNTVKWDGVGPYAISDAAVQHGEAVGGDAKFVSRLTANTSWLTIE